MYQTANELFFTARCVIVFVFDLTKITDVNDLKARPWLCQGAIVTECVCVCMWADSSRVVQHRGPSLPYQFHSVVWHTQVQTSHVAHARSRIPPLSDRVRNRRDHVGISNQLRDEFQHSSYWSRVVGHHEEVVFAPLDITAAREVCDSHHPARHTLIYIYISIYLYLSL